jgi:hypothetical protein
MADIVTKPWEPLSGQCEGVTTDGSRCRNRVKPPERFCHLHPPTLRHKLFNLPSRRRLAYWLSILLALTLWAINPSAPFKLYTYLKRPAREMDVRKVLRRFYPLSQSFSFTKARVTAVKPHLIMNLAFGRFAVRPFNNPADASHPTLLKPYENTGNSRKVDVALTNTGGPATGGNLIILYEDTWSVACDNCDYAKYILKPESIFAGITIPFELTDSRPKFMTLLIQGAPDSYITLKFIANTHEIIKDVNLGGAKVDFGFQNSH